MKNKSVIYVNYSPYENSGHILDYLRENFRHVFLFTLAFHNLGGKAVSNKLTIYSSGKLVSEESLIFLRIPQSLVLYLIPLRSFMNLFQIIWKAIWIFIKYGKVDVFFSVNAFAMFIGSTLKQLGFIRECNFWVWDYYPATHPKLPIRFMRWIYWKFDALATYSDKVVYLNHKLANVRVAHGLLDSSKDCKIVPIGTGKPLPVRKKDLKNLRIGFIGVLKKSQGIDMLITAHKVLSRYFNNLSFEIIGSGPDEEHFKRSVPKNSSIKYNFHGLVSEDKLKDILYDCSMGIAPYLPGDATVSKYADPGKPKLYLDYNLPQITTDVIEFSKEITDHNAGIVVQYGDAKELALAIKNIVTNYNEFTKGAVKLNKKYYYKKLYKPLFT